MGPGSASRVTCHVSLLSVGEVVGVEEAAVWRLLPSPQLKRVCCHCLLEAPCPLPCNRCSLPSFHRRRTMIFTFHKSVKALAGSFNKGYYGVTFCNIGELLLPRFTHSAARCAAVTFCSVACRDEAWRSHHRWECAWSLMDLHQTRDGEEVSSGVCITIQHIH